MKTITKIRGLLGLLLLSALFARCDNSSNEDSLVGIKPVLLNGKSGDQLTTFFDDNLWWISQFIFGDYGESKLLVDTCVMINSVEEFQRINSVNDMTSELPIVDFDAYTLVVGQYITTEGSTHLASQNLISELNAATINLILTPVNDDHTAHVWSEPFWALYPKITAESISLNITLKTE